MYSFEHGKVRIYIDSRTAFELSPSGVSTMFNPLDPEYRGAVRNELLPVLMQGLLVNKVRQLTEEVAALREDIHNKNSNASNQGDYEPVHTDAWYEVTDR